MMKSMSEPWDLSMHPATSQAVTNHVRVEVESQYAAEHSHPGMWRFFYTVRITNEGGDRVQLLNRHWIISDASGQTQHVRGEGVVGEQPALGPGESFQYTSWCELRTPDGVMRGTYDMVDSNGTHFDAEIAPFALHGPYTVH